MPGVFISYRRGSASAYAGRLHDRLAQEFGRDRVFMDLSAIGPGADFVERIEREVGDADALLVVIGPDWADAADAEGRRRLEDPQDFVRREVLGAIERDTLVVPVLVQGAQMPPAEALPEPLRALGRRNAITLTDAGWQDDVDRLIEALRERIRVRRGRGRRRAALAAAGLATAAVLAVVALVGDGGGGGAGGPKAERLRVSAQAAVGGYPISAAAAAGKVYVAQDTQDRLKIVDARSREVADSATLGSKLSAVALGGGRLWVGDYGRRPVDGKGTVVDLDPRTGRRLGEPIPTIDPTVVAADDESVWVSTEVGVLERIDPATRAATARIRIDDFADLALLGGTLWATKLDAGQLVRYDARTGRPIGGPTRITRPVSVAASDGNVWVASEQGQLYRVPTRGGRPESVPVGGEGLRVVAADASRVWVADAQGNVVLVDPRRLAIRARLKLEGSIQDIALDGAAAWVVRAQSGETSTVERVEAAPAGT